MISLDPSRAFDLLSRSSRRAVQVPLDLCTAIIAMRTAWLYERLAEETGEAWAHEFLTMFADDRHLSREISS